MRVFGSIHQQMGRVTLRKLIQSVQNLTEHLLPMTEHPFNYSQTTASRPKKQTHSRKKTINLLNLIIKVESHHVYFLSTYKNSPPNQAKNKFAKDH